MTTKTAARSATHQGQCQVCGRLQMLPGGLLSKHGYNVKWGFFNGVCWGAGHLPFELSKDLIEDAIARATAQRNGLIEDAASLRSNLTPASAWVYEYVGSRTRYGESHVWREISRDQFEVTEFSVSYPASKDSQSHSNKNGRVSESRYGESLDQIMVKHNSYRASILDGIIKELAQYVAWQKARIEKWAPHPEKLVPVEPKKDAPVHFRHNGGKSCVSGYSQARYHGVSTDDVSKVTCERCKSYRFYQDALKAAQ